jgi:hypothetical protein
MKSSTPLRVLLLSVSVGDVLAGEVLGGLVDADGLRMTDCQEMQGNAEACTQASRCRKRSRALWIRCRVSPCPEIPANGYEVHSRDELRSLEHASCCTFRDHADEVCISEHTR